MTTEQRKFCRIPAENRVFIELEAAHFEGDNVARIAQCRSLDVSRTGMRVEVDQPVIVGAILQIGVDLPNSDDTLYLAGEVMWCTADPQTTNNWLAGFRLLNADESDIDHWYTLWAIQEE